MNQKQIIRRMARTSRRGRMAVAGACAVIGVLTLAAQTQGQTTQPASEATMPAAEATNQLIVSGLQDGKISLTVNKSTVLTTARPYKRVNVSQPEVADVNLLGPRSVLVTAKKAGATQLIVWDDQDRTQVVNVTVNVDMDALRSQIKQMFPGSKIEVSEVNGSIALRGAVPSLETADQVVQVATPYGKKVLNFLQVAGGQQVMLKVRFAEVSRTAESDLGMNFGMSDGTFSIGSNVGQISPLGLSGGGGAVPPQLATGATGTAVSLFGAGKMGGTAFAYYLSALRSNGLMRILAEPNLVAISGQEASFLAGGEFPVPVPQPGSGGNTVTIDYQEFGVRLNMTPVVLGNGMIRMKVAPEVSQLDYTTGTQVGGVTVPGLTTRKVNTTIELGEGQTFAIAGLFQNNVTASNSTTPLLGDLPVLGALFRSVRYQKKQTELVVLVTPYLVSGMNPDQVPTLPGEHWRDPTEKQLFMDSDLGGPTTRPTTPPATYEGEHGFTEAK
jgi:pilus assembly protein CpaC